MKILLDTNVIIDVLTHREPHFQSSAEILELCKRGLVEGVICSLSYATIAYIVGKKTSKDILYSSLDMLVNTCKVSVVDYSVISEAIISRRDDFEDAIQFYSALTADVDCIVTRDKDGFSDLPIPILTPYEFMSKCTFAK